MLFLPVVLILTSVRETSSLRMAGGHVGVDVTMYVPNFTVQLNLPKLLHSCVIVRLIYLSIFNMYVSRAVPRPINGTIVPSRRRGDVRAPGRPRFWCVLLFGVWGMSLLTSASIQPTHDCLPGFSLEELGIRALQSLPRDQAIDGIRAFNEMRCVGSSFPWCYCLLRISVISSATG